MTPLEHYRQDLKAGRLEPDAAQAALVKRLQFLFDELTAADSPAGWWQKLVRRWSGSPARPVRGLYIWGSVGRGKTMLVDMFYSHLPFEQKLRMHFHRFMQQIHRELGKLKDTSDPLQIVADRFAERARVICFDEFHVDDITDAMLLGGLLKALFDRGVILIATSNTEPARLYWDGLQRERFLPAIALIEEHTEVVCIGGEIDHRLQFLDTAEIYHAPLDEQAGACLQRNFEHLAPEPGSENAVIEIEGRSLQTVREADGIVWFEFDALCDGPRSAADYIEIARTYQTVLVANVPRLGTDNEDQARRLINLVDELYDRRVKLIMSAAELPQALYCGSRHAADFQRTISRLIEMRSHAYLAGSHRP